MSSVYIVRRPSKKGDRFHVRWERGRADPVVHLGVFPTATLAKARVKSAFEQLARGEAPTKDPITATKIVGQTVSQTAAEWLASRIDVSDHTTRNFESAILWIEKKLGDIGVMDLSVSDIQDWIAFQVAGGAAPSSIRLRMTTLSQILDFAEIEPNPALSRRLRKPRAVRKEYRLPTRGELALIYEQISPKTRDAVRMIEQTGMRVGEVVMMRWEHIDRPRKRILVAEAKTVAGTRWVEQLNGLPEIPEQPEGMSDNRRVFQVTEASIAGAMRYACEKAGIRTYSPHDLRHLHAGRLLHDGVLSPAQIAQRLGHATPLITLGTYSHVVPPD